jgi:hypothetical protein
MRAFAGMTEGYRTPIYGALYLGLPQDPKAFTLSMPRFKMPGKPGFGFAQWHEMAVHDYSGGSIRESI